VSFQHTKSIQIFSERVLKSKWLQQRATISAIANEDETTIAKFTNPTQKMNLGRLKP
jgi:hypothetical protein